jgi:hypothetical protein
MKLQRFVNSFCSKFSADEVPKDDELNGQKGIEHNDANNQSRNGFQVCSDTYQKFR